MLKMVMQSLVIKKKSALKNSNIKAEYSGSISSGEYKLLNSKFRIPKDLAREISALYRLGLKDDEIRYILHVKAKEESGAKWN